MAKGGGAGNGRGGGGGAAAYNAAAASAESFLNNNQGLKEAIENYTLVGYEAVNGMLRDGYSAFEKMHGKEEAKATLKEAQMVQRAVNRATEAGHAFKGDVTRRQNMSASQIASIAKTRKFTNRSLLSTTTSKSLKSFSGNVKMHIKQRSGIAVERVTSVRGEREVIIPAGRQFSVSKMRTIKGVTHIYMRQTGNN